MPAAAGVARSMRETEPRGAAKGKETILVVDDEPGVRKLCGLVLQRAGYTVLEADSAVAARQVWQSRSRDIDLLLTDYNMPGPTGLDLCERLHAESGRLRLVLMSAACKEEMSCPPFVAFLQKPFTLLTLTETVRRQLQSVTPPI